MEYKHSRAIPLSDEEQRALTALSRGLADQDPELALSLRHYRVTTDGALRATLGATLLAGCVLIGIGTLVGGVLIGLETAATAFLVVSAVGMLWRRRH